MVHCMADDPIVGDFCCVGSFVLAVIAGISAGIGALAAYASGSDTLFCIAMVAAGLGCCFFCTNCTCGLIQRYQERRFNRSRQPTKIVTPVESERHECRLIFLRKDGLNSCVVGTALSGNQLFQIADTNIPMELQASHLRDAIAKALGDSPENFRLYSTSRLVADTETVEDVDSITAEQAIGTKSYFHDVVDAPNTLLAQLVGATCQLDTISAKEVAPAAARMTVASATAHAQQDLPQDDVLGVCV